MAKFYLMGNYTAKAFQGFIAQPDSDRGAAIKAVAEAIGGKVLSYDIVRGSYDFIVAIEAPNFESMAAAKLATEASGAVTNITIMESININNEYVPINKMLVNFRIVDGDMEFEKNTDFDFNSLKIGEFWALSSLPPSIMMIIRFFLFMIKKN